MTDTTIWSDEYEDDPKWGRRRLTREEAWQRKEILRGTKGDARDVGVLVAEIDALRKELLVATWRRWLPKRMGRT